MSIDSLDYRKTIGLFATGVTVLANGDADNLRAMTANAVTSVSLEPMLLLTCVHKEASLAEHLIEGHGFSVNILETGQRRLSNYFAGMDLDNPPNYRFEWVDGLPRLAGCLGTIFCSLYRLDDGGDHWIAVGQVIGLQRNPAASDPLLYFKGSYREVMEEREYDIPVSWDFSW
jgi:flavin reductase (DIM6/NTAB) family NADH-FMN oxidoreductase RutF